MGRMELEHLPFFVYGTLKRGQVAVGRWPHPPQRVEPAFARGTLFDLGPYPVLAHGEDVILGELWHIAVEHMPDTAAALDRYEGCGGDETDLYMRRVTTVKLQDGSARKAYAYFIADPKTLNDAHRVTPNQEGICEWKR